jgi:hypothetical protein
MLNILSGLLVAGTIHDEKMMDGSLQPSEIDLWMCVEKTAQVAGD